VYSWHVEGDTEYKGVYFDFHGHPTSEHKAEFPEGYFLSYETGEQPSRNGNFTAPFAGYQGWFFMNLEYRPITIVIEVSGYYDEHLELYRAVNGEVLLARPF
jgi:hypothetical protein